MLITQLLSSVGTWKYNLCKKKNLF